MEITAWFRLYTDSFRKTFTSIYILFYKKHSNFIEKKEFLTASAANAVQGLTKSSGNISSPFLKSLTILKEIERNWTELNRIERNWMELKGIERNYMKLSKIERNCTKLNETEQNEKNWTKFNEIEQNWGNERKEKEKIGKGKKR